MKPKSKTYVRPAGLKLPDDFLGTVAALLNTPPPPKGTRKKAKKRKPAKKLNVGRK